MGHITGMIHSTHHDFTLTRSIRVFMNNYLFIKFEVTVLLYLLYKFHYFLSRRFVLNMFTHFIYI